MDTQLITLAAPINVTYTSENSSEDQYGVAVAANIVGPGGAEERLMYLVVTPDTRPHWVDEAWINDASVTV